jgi:YggT family protein
MLVNALIFLLDTIASAFCAVLLLRFHMQAVRASFNNPVSQFAMALTDFAVKPARRVIPGLWGMDLATLSVAWLTQWVLLLLVAALQGHLGDFGGTTLLALFLFAFIELLKIALWMVILLQFMLFVVSIANPYSPYMGLLNTLSRPFSRPIQRVLPTVGNIDLSPMAVLMICYMLLLFFLPWLSAVIRAGVMG